ncbi:MAG TPA: outer membrane beta-barrel protein [Casimicrobiaceae bacterium]
MPAPASGFYGGIAFRENGADDTGVLFGAKTSTWGRFVSPVADDTAASRSLLFGGYRWSNDLALEASLNTSERYALRPETPSGRSGVGLSLVPADTNASSWNANVFGSWSFMRRLSLYGRLGYAQTDNGATTFATLPVDPRRGVNYGVGLRYDLNTSLGLRLEYARFPRFAGETVQSGVLPESDQLQLGVQLRF